MTDLFSDLPKTLTEATAIGSTHYFTGKECKCGHISKRLTSTRGCVECHLNAMRAYRESNKEAVKEQRRAQYESNKEAVKEQSRAYREANKEAAKDYQKAYYATNKETITEKQKAYYAENKEAVKEQSRSHYAAKVGKSPEEIGTRRKQLEPSRYVYFLVIKDAVTNEKLFLKVGITNNPTHRLKQHKRHLAKEGLMFDTILIKDFGTEEAARAIEAKIKNSFIVYESGIEGFTSECFMYLPQFESSMLTLLNS